MMGMDKWDALRAIATIVSAERPDVGRRVRIVRGKKYKGREGVVVRHFRDKYQADAFWYKDSMQLHMMEMRGRKGYRVKVKDDNGEFFYVFADYNEILQDQKDED